jgi:hypothetical protein
VADTGVDPHVFGVLEGFDGFGEGAFRDSSDLAKLALCDGYPVVRCVEGEVCEGEEEETWGWFSAA